MFIEIWTGQSRSKLDTEIATHKREQDTVMAESDEIDVTTTVQSSFNLARKDYSCQGPWRENWLKCYH